VLHLSQPAVTGQLRRLEAALGVALFVRSAQGITPTREGERLIPVARQLQHLLEQAVAAVGSDAVVGGPLVIAASTTVTAHLLPPLLARFRAARPEMAVRVLSGNTEDVLDAVRRRRAPLGLVEGLRRTPGLRLEAFQDDELFPVMAPDAPFRDAVSARLAAVPLLWRERGSGTRAVLERAFRAAGIRHLPGPLDLELRGTEAILGAASVGLGIGFVSRWSARAHLLAGLLVPVTSTALRVRRTFSWVLPAGVLGGRAAEFHAFAQRNPPVMP